MIFSDFEVKNSKIQKSEIVILQICATDILCEFFLQFSTKNILWKNFITFSFSGRSRVRYYKEVLQVSCRYRQRFNYSRKKTRGGVTSPPGGQGLRVPSVYRVSFRGEPHSDLNWNWMKDCEESEYELSLKIEWVIISQTKIIKI